jgi:hypothetical protein
MPETPPGLMRTGNEKFVQRIEAAFPQRPG